MRILKLGFEEICRAIDKEKGLSDVLLAVMELQGRVIDNEPRGEAEIVITDLSRSRKCFGISALPDEEASMVSS